MIVYNDIRARRDRRAAALVETVSAASGGDAVLLSRLEQDPQLQATLAAALEAAVKTSHDAKRKLLALAVAEAVTDPTKDDDAQLMVDTLSQLDVPHIKALQRLAQEADDLVASQEANSMVQWGISDVWQAQPAPIKAALLRVGAAKASPGTYIASEDGKLAEGISDYGRQILDALRLVKVESDHIDEGNGGSSRQA